MSERLAQDGSRQTGSTMGVGIIGLGAVGKLHAAAIDETDGLQITATLGGDGLPGVARHKDVASLLADPAVEAVAVCSPSGLHAAHTIAALEAGKHVLVEKPIATSTADALAVVAAAERAATRGIVAGAVSQRRLEPQHLHLKQLIDQGDLGRPILGEALVRWHRDAAYYEAVPWRRANPEGGSLMNQGMHSLDLLRWLFGEIDEVAAITATRVAAIEAEDTSVAALRFASAALGSLVTSTATQPGSPAELNLYFAKGAISIHHTSVVRWEVDAPPPPEPQVAMSGASSPILDTGGHRRQWTDLAHAIATGDDPMITMADAAGTVAVIDAVYKSSATGARVSPGRS